MVDLLTVALAGLVVYLLLVVLARASGVVPDSVNLSGPIVTIRTQHGKALLDRLARPKRFWRAWGNLGVGVALVVLVLSFLAVISSGLQTAANPEQTAVNQPRNVLAIPGVNDFLPLSMAPEILLGLAVGLVVHEGGHGLLCRVEDIDIDSMGLVLLTLLPIGAFVEPDEADRAKTNRGGQIRMFAAGVTNNFALAGIAFVLLFGPVAGSIAVAPGAPVGAALPNSAADEAGLAKGDVITALEGEAVANASDLASRLDATDEPTVTVETRDGDEVAVDRTLLVSESVRGAPLGINTTLDAVNGTAVATEAGLGDALADRRVAAFATADGETVTAPAGALVVPTEDSALLRDSIAPGTDVVVAAVDGDRTLTGADFRSAITDRAGEDVALTAYVDGEPRELSVAVPNDVGADGRPLGLLVAPGITGMQLEDFGTRFYPADTFLGFLGGDSGGTVASISFVQRMVTTIVLPLGGAAGLEFGFRGFDSAVRNFYETTGPLGLLGDHVFTLANVLFWTGWINLIIGQFNCIPAYPLDGGHMLRVSAESVVSRLPIGNRRSVVTAVTTGFTLLILGALFAVVGLPALLN